VHYPDDTIAAVASPPGGAARGIVRVCGPQAVDFVATCFEPDHGPNSHEFPDDRLDISHIRSYARQPTAELRTLGSSPPPRRGGNDKEPSQKSPVHGTIA